jgi:hypothetical protein
MERQALRAKAMTDSKTPPKYNVAIVESVLLEVATDLHPQHLTARELSLRIVSDASDSREVETAAQAIRGLREFGLFSDREDEIVQPTPAALRARALLA